MRRILIIGVILVGTWFVFQELECGDNKENPQAECISECKWTYSEDEFKFKCIEGCKKLKTEKEERTY